MLYCIEMDFAESTTCVEYNVGGLINAVQWGDLSYVECAIDGCGLSPNTTDADNCSLLHWASINNRLSIVEFLILKKCQFKLCWWQQHGDAAAVGIAE